VADGGEGSGGPGQGPTRGRAGKQLYRVMQGRGWGVGGGGGGGGGGDGCGRCGWGWLDRGFAGLEGYGY
ncbi:hypothetical protein, partial [Neisseria arctica]|uniref:hypothetical protein n=1 Tax=Neisseria arctica TaxID=1470200 RepID=UPI00191019F8